MDCHLSRMQASASRFDMYSLFTRIGALQFAGALAYAVRAKVGALVLGPGGVGLVSVIDQFVLLMLQLFAFSIPFASVKVLSKAHSQSIDSFKAAYSAIMQLLLILGSIGAAVGMVTFVVRPGWVSTSLADHTALVGIGLLAIPAMILCPFFRNVPAAAMQPVTSAVWDAITAAIISGAVVIGILLAGVNGYFVGTLMGCVVVSTTYYSYLARRFGVSLVGKPSSVRSFLKANASFVELSLTSYIGSFVTPLALLVVRLTTLHSLGIAAAGILQAAIGVSLAINLLLNPLNGLLLTPLVNRTLADSNKFQATRQFQQKLLLAIAIVALPPIVFPDLTVLALYSSRFVEAADSLYLFVLSQAIMQVNGIATALMIGLDRLKAYAAVMVTGTAIHAALALLLVPRLGILGAGVAAVTSATALALGTFGYLRVRNGFRIGTALQFGSLLLFIALGVAGALIGTRPSFGIGILLFKLVVCASFLTFMISVSLDRTERRALLARFGVASSNR
jgi:O-antigen/teichoic acid export membrane protein